MSKPELNCKLIDNAELAYCKLKASKENTFVMALGAIMKGQKVSVIDYISKSVRVELYDGPERRRGEGT